MMRCLSLVATVVLTSACGSGVQAPMEAPHSTEAGASGPAPSHGDAGLNSAPALQDGAPAAPDAASVAGEAPDAAESSGAVPKDASADATTRFRLCSWNVKKMGHGTKDYATVASVIDDECDAALLLEVMQKQGKHPGYEDLLGALGTDWTGTITDSPRPNTTSSNSEFYAIVWRAGALTWCDGWDSLQYATDNDGSTDAGTDHFSREPAYGCFQVAGPRGRFDFVVAAYHAVWGDGSPSTIGDEVGHLAGVVQEMMASRPGENDILILGDFNLVPGQLAQATEMVDWTTGTGSTLNVSGAITSNLYDHVLVNDLSATPEVTKKAVVLDVTDRVASGKVFYNMVSDHLPVRVTLTIGGRDDD